MVNAVSQMSLESWRGVGISALYPQQHKDSFELLSLPPFIRQSNPETRRVTGEGCLCLTVLVCCPAAGSREEEEEEDVVLPRLFWL